MPLPENATALGKIGGPLLAENLLRDGIDLAFETDLVYLDVTTLQVGINTADPLTTLYVNSTTHTNNLVVTDYTGDTGSLNITFNDNEIGNITDRIYIRPNQSSNPTVLTTRIGTDELRISSHLIENIVTNQPINLTPALGNTVNFTTTVVEINENLDATGDITCTGTIIIGDGDPTDHVIFGADINSSLIPNADNLYNLGSPSKYWKNLYAAHIDAIELDINNISTITIRVDGDGILRGNVIFGNSSSDQIYVKATVSNDLIPTTLNRTLGSITGPVYWNTLFITGVSVDNNIDIRNNTVTTLQTDNDLVLTANNTGIVNVTTTDVTITNDLTVLDHTTLTDVGITGLLNLTGDYTYTQTGTTHRTGSTDITGSITVNGPNTIQFEDIKFVSNDITTTLTNSDLILVANGAGIVKTATSDVVIDNNLLVSTTAYINTVQVNDTIVADNFTINNVYISDNTITTLSNNDLELSANGNGIVNVTTTDVTITNDLTVLDHTTLADVGITGLLNLTGDYTYTQTGTTHRTGSTDITGSLTVNGLNTVQFEDIKFVSNDITTTVTNSDLILVANGTGIVKTATSDVVIDNNLLVSTKAYIGAVNVDTSTTADVYNVGDFYITDNIISTDTTDTDIVLTADGTGIVNVTTTDVTITNDLTVLDHTTLADVGITGLLNLTGNYTYTQTGTSDRTGSTDITGSLTVNGPNTVQFEDIKFTSNDITTTLTDSSLTLVAGAVKLVKTATSDVTITNDLTVQSTAYIGTVNVDTNVTSDIFDIGDFYITDNIISTNTTDTSIVLTADGTGIVNVTTTDVTITNDLTVLDHTTLADVGITGLLNLTGDYTYTQTGTTHRTGSTDITGSLTVNGPNTVQFEDIKFVSNDITTTLTDSNLTLVADGTGIVKTATSDVTITNDLGVQTTGYITTVNVDMTATSDIFDINSIYITNNSITTDVLNTDLVLKANGSGIVNVTTTDVTITNDLTVLDHTTLADVSITGLLNLIGDYTYTQTGTTHRTGSTDITGSLTVNGPNTIQFEDIKFTSNDITTTLTDSNLILVANGTGIVKTATSDVVIENNLLVSTNAFTNTVNVDMTATADIFDIDDFYITDNIISTNTTDTSIVLTANGTGIVNVTTTDVTITNDLTVLDHTTLADVGITGLLNLIGDYTYTQTGTTHRTGNTNITGSLTVNGPNTVQFEDIKFVSNDITTTVTDSSLILTAGATKLVKTATSDVVIENNLDVIGSTNFGSLGVTQQLSSTDLTIDDVYIVDNTITTVNTDEDLILSATGTGIISIPLNNVAISQNLAVVGPATVNGNTSLKSTIIRSETVTPTTTPSAMNYNADGSAAYFFRVYGPVHPAEGYDRIQPGWTCVQLPGSIVVSNVPDPSDNNESCTITITGGTFVQNTFYSFTGNVTTYGPATLTQVGNIDQTGDTNLIGNFESGTISGLGLTSYLSVPDIKINNNIIEVTALDTNLYLYGNGSGGVTFDNYLKITTNQISNVFSLTNVETDLSIIFTPNGTGNFVINKTNALTIPIGNDTNRVLANVGEIRQNSTSQLFEGRLSTGLARFNNVYNQNLSTFITPELTPGENDNIIRFGVSGTVQATIDSTKLYSNTMHAGDIKISGLTISNLTPSNDILFPTPGNGSIVINDIDINKGVITNNTNNTLTIQSTGVGYVEFQGKSIIFPRGNSGSRGTTFEVGQTRFNTQLNYFEVYDGTNWVSAGGSSAFATLEEIQAELDLWSLILG